MFGVYPDTAVSGETGAGDSGPRFFAELRLELPSASHAGALVSMITLVRSFILRDTAGEGGFLLAPLLFANAPVPDDSSLILRTAAMDAGEIALLFTMFSVYSR
jgi:hypothetical protein